MWDVSSRWDPARAYRHAAVVEVWSESKLIATTDQFVDGQVSEKRVTGIRRSLSLSVEPTRQWLRWLRMPMLELAVWSGFSWGRSEELLPLGVFPVLAPGLSAPLTKVDVDADDWWQRVVSADFMIPQASYPGSIRDAIARLVSEVHIGGTRIHPVTKVEVGEPLITASSTAVMPNVVWGDKSRHETVVELCESIGAEAFIDRYGRPVVQDRANQPGRDLSDGPGGTVRSVSTSVDWTPVRNTVYVEPHSSTKDIITPFDPVMYAITEPAHPANVFHIGQRTVKLSSPLILDHDQAVKAAVAELAKRSAPALSWSVACDPDPSREPGDELTVTTRDLGSVRGVVEEVTHPLGDGAQTVKLGAVL